MEIHYRLHTNYAEIVRCYGTDSRIVLPAEISGYPVCRIAAYAFSARKASEEEDVLSVETEERFLFREQERLLAGTEVQEVVFPDTVAEIGNYIFYGCKELRRLEFSDALMGIGSGAFTGCGRLDHLEVRMNHGRKSCVKEVLGDLWQRIDVAFRYKTKVGTETAKLVFPEHYEEAVENTPARILFTQHHGTGNNYRQCFYGREMDYRKYDELFTAAKAQESLGVLTDMVFDRLLYPVELSEQHRDAYETYLREHLTEIAPLLAGKEEKGQEKRLAYLSRDGFWSENALDAAVEAAQENGNGEVLSSLMDIRHDLFPKKKRKRFEL